MLCRIRESNKAGTQTPTRAAHKALKAMFSPISVNVNIHCGKFKRNLRTSQGKASLPFHFSLLPVTFTQCAAAVPGSLCTEVRHKPVTAKRPQPPSSYFSLHRPPFETRPHYEIQTVGYFPYLDYIITYANVFGKAVFGYKYFFRHTVPSSYPE